MKKLGCLGICICALLLLLSGCEEKEPPAVTENQVWETMPQLTRGTMESEKLEVLPWYDGRTEAASQCAMGETELGYYWSLYGYLFYADKVNLGNWVIVCNQPDCDHSLNWSYGEVKCNGHNRSGSFLLRNGRIYFAENSGWLPEIYYNKSKFGDILVSRAADGTDVRLELALEDAMMAGAGTYVARLTSTQYIVAAVELQTDGTYLSKVYRATKDGVKLIEESAGEKASARIFLRLMRGDEVFAVDDIQSHYRFVGDELKPVYNGLWNGYLTGNTLRVFRQNDGYYDTDLDTMAEIFLAPAQLENSIGVILLPNCIIETTMYEKNTVEDLPDKTHKMTVFDGTQWRNVRLPDALSASGIPVNASSFTVTSDSVFFTVSQKDRPFEQFGGLICRIDLSKEELAVEICQQLVMPDSVEEQA